MTICARELALVGVVDRRQLQQQALGDVARADARRIERLHALQRDLHLGFLDRGRHARRLGELVELDAQVAVVVERFDDRAGERVIALLERQHVDLAVQVLAQADVGGDHVERADVARRRLAGERSTTTAASCRARTARRRSAPIASRSMPRGSLSPSLAATSTWPASCGESSTSRKGLRPIASWTSWAKSSDESCSSRTACCSRGVTVCCCRWRGCRVRKFIVRSVRYGSEKGVATGARRRCRGALGATPVPHLRTAPFTSEKRPSRSASRRGRAGVSQAALAVSFSRLRGPRRASARRRTNAGRKTRREPSGKTTVTPSASTASTMPRP